ncbi:hypothetical protein [Cryptosporangium sp. NPDC048952]|uniref:hypothetical protein n=1 Tax=Cryptosporangium sp. NPDC048952 TaxID=3363961 RepID=UPI003710142C
MDDHLGADLDGYAIVAGHWPLVGPYSPLRTTYAAQAVRAVAAYLGHAVVAKDGLVTPKDTEVVLADLRAASERLVQVIVSVEERSRQANATG